MSKNNIFPSYYVYFHIDPFTKEIVYIGKGCGGRAWDVTRNRGQHNEHVLWMKNLINLGYIPSDWVEIKKKNLTEKEAFSLEKKLTHENGILKFNRQSGEKQHQSKLTNEQVIKIYKRLIFNNESPLKIAEEFNVSKAAIYMIKNRKQWRAVTANIAND